MNKINYKTGILSLLLFFVAWGCKDDDDDVYYYNSYAYAIGDMVVKEGESVF